MKKVTIFGVLLVMINILSSFSLISAFDPPPMYENGVCGSYELVVGVSKDVTGDIYDTQLNDNENLELPSMYFFGGQTVDVYFEPFGSDDSDDRELYYYIVSYDLKDEWTNPLVKVFTYYSDGSYTITNIRGKETNHYIYPTSGKVVTDIRLWLDSGIDKMRLCVDYISLTYEV